MLVTLFGIVTEVSFLQYVKALIPIFVTFRVLLLKVTSFGITTEPL